jgi:hypothetical protein
MGVSLPWRRGINLPWGEGVNLRGFSIILTKFTFSSIVILGYSLTQFVIPIIFTLLEGKSIVYNLKYPYSVFIHSTLALTVLLAAHNIYMLCRKTKGITSTIYTKLHRSLVRYHFFKSPTDKQLWIIGGIGVVSMVVTLIATNGYDTKNNNDTVLYKFLEGLNFYAYAPLFLFTKKLYNPTVSHYKKKTIWKVIIYTILIFCIGVAANTRSLFMIGITSVGIAYFIGLLINIFNYKIFKVKKILIGLIGFWLVTGPIADLGTAMVVVREQRSDISPIQLLSKTLEVYQNKNELKFYRYMASKEVSDWDESYFDNIFLARFSNIKFTDASLEQAFILNGADKGMLQYSIDRIWAILPNPILNIFGIHLDKKTTTSYSFGDYLYDRAGGEDALGGFRTGHFAGTGMATFGWFYLLFLGIGIIPLYLLFDLFVMYKSDRFKKNVQNYYSLAGLLSVTVFFTFFGNSTASESIINIFTYLIRGWLQLCFLYWLVFLVARKLSN